MFGTGYETTNSAYIIIIYTASRSKNKSKSKRTNTGLLDNHLGPPKAPQQQHSNTRKHKKFQFQIRKHNTEVSGQWVTVCPVDTSRNSVYRKQGYPPPHVCSALGLTRTPIYGWADHEGRTHFSPKHDTHSRASLPQSQKHNTVCLVKTDLIDPKAHFSPQREGEVFLQASPRQV